MYLQPVTMDFWRTKGGTWMVMRFLGYEGFLMGKSMAGPVMLGFSQGHSGYLSESLFRVIMCVVINYNFSIFLI